MSLIRSKDAALYYEELGSGETMILLPGLLGTIESHWRRFIPDFARHFHVIAMDLRGHGKTDNPSGRIRLHQLVTDLFSLYETLEIDSAHICGYSLGGYIGLAFGIQHPGRVESLMMHGTKFDWTPDAIDSAAGELDAGRILEKVPAWAEQLQKEHISLGSNGWQSLVQTANEFIETLPDEGLTENALRLAGFPVLVSVGDSDEMVPQTEAERLAQLLPYGMPHVFRNTAHPFSKLDKKAFLDIAFSFFNVPHREESKPKS